ncbi:MAG TPA: Rrf2 family transcriptional regulator [Solirubrobacterales bacterium]
MRVSAKAEYAVRALLVLADEGPDPVKAERIADAQKIPLRFLENILAELRHHGLIQSQRGVDGGYWLSRGADETTIADVIRAVEGPLASIQSERPEGLAYTGPAEPLQKVWIALRGSMRTVLEAVSLADVAADELPAEVIALLDRPEAWEPR